MKNIISVMALTAILLAACNSGGSTATENNNTVSAADSDPGQAQTTMRQIVNNASVSDIISGYLTVKNALTADNGDDAATGANTMIAVIPNIDTTAFTAGQRKVYKDIMEDLKEHGEHIGANAKDIAHQREHFDLLSKDIYDLAKAFPTQVLYKDYCPMYNGGKGAVWISETKEIKNPYYGKSMLTCGSMKEAIKQ